MSKTIDNQRPLILYIPGLLPKPSPELHRAALLRCLVAGIRRVDEAIAAAIMADERCFQIVPWTFDFYGSHRRMEEDQAGIEALLAQPQAAARDREEATSLKRRLVRRLYHLGNLLPFLIPHVADERMEVHLRDLRRYLTNQRGIAQRIRHKLKTPLREAARQGRPVLLLAHSMGSVIAWDSLWQMTHRDDDDARVDLWVTMGSPLGLSYIRKRIKGAGDSDAARYPHNVNRWQNLSAHGDLTAIDPRLRDNYSGMLDHTGLCSLEDTQIYTWFRLHGVLNVHAEYGYLVHEATAGIVCDWWSGPGVNGP